VILVGRSLERLKDAIPKDFKGPGRSLFLAKDVSTVRIPAPCRAKSALAHFDAWCNCTHGIVIRT